MKVTKGKIYGYQYICIIILSCLGTLFMLGIPERLVGHNAYLACLMAVPIGILLNTLFIKLFTVSGAQSLYEVNTFAFGKWVGKGVTFLYGLYFLLIAIAVLNYYGLFTVNLILRQMRMVAFLTPVVLVIAYGAKKGATTMGRMAVILVGVMLIIALISIGIEVFYVEPENLLPVLNVERGDFIGAMFTFAFLQMGELMAVYALIPKVEVKKRSVLKISLISMLVGTGFVILFTLMNSLILGNTMSLQYAAFIRVMRVVDLGEMINRMEILVVSGYFFASVFRVMVDLYMVAVCMKDTFGLSTHKHLAFPLGIILILATSLFSNVTNLLIRYYTEIYPYIALAIQVILPAVTLIAVSIAKRKKTHQLQASERT